MQFTKVHQKLAKPVYEAIPKIAREAGKKWEWEPQLGEWCINDRNEVKLIVVARPTMVDWIDEADGFETTQIYAVTPLFHWEDHLELILKGMGWNLWNMERTVPSSDGTGSLVVVELAKGELVKRGRGKDRQESFQRAVLAVAEEKE